MRETATHVCKTWAEKLTHPIMKIGHVNNIPTMQSFTGISWNTQSKSCVIIDWVCLEFPKQCIVGYSLTCLIGLACSNFARYFTSNIKTYMYFAIATLWNYPCYLISSGRWRVWALRSVVFVSRLDWPRKLERNWKWNQRLFTATGPVASRWGFLANEPRQA